MLNENRLNPEKGRVFQEQVRKALEKCYGVEFLLNYPVPSGEPPKPHKFDLVFYLSFLPSNVHKLLVIRHDVHPVRNETLAHSYVNANRHLLRGVEVLEFDPTSNELAI